MSLLSLFGKKAPAVLTSETVCFAPIGGCLNTVQETLDTDGVWRPRDDMQSWFLKNYFEGAREQIRNLHELKSIASPDANEINRFLADQGFQIRLPSFREMEVGFASVFKLRAEWLEPGSVTVITTPNDQEYPAVRIGNGQRFHTSRYAKEPVVSIDTKNGDTICMSAFEGPPTGFALVELVNRIRETCQPCGDFNKVVFPMIDHDQMVDISWIEGMSTQGLQGPWGIGKALQQTKFRMNEFGAKVESAVAMGVRFMYCGGGPPPKPDLIIDKPFLLWIIRPGLDHPLFIAHFTEVDWKRPDQL